MRRWLAFALAWVLILGGAFLAHSVQTGGGTTVTEVRIPAGEGVSVSALLYTPANATAASPAPGILVSHGYINTREMQSPFAIELSRRGYVVLSMDMTGHGYSGGIVGTADFGGPAALAWLKSLPTVDPDRIGMEGHSMGGGPILAAAAGDPDGYRALVLEGSTPGLLGAKAPANPRNLAIVFGQYDEFAGLMWGVSKGSEIGASPKLQKLFGVTGRVRENYVYGSVAQGTGRALLNPPITHPWEHFSEAGVAGALGWFNRVIPAPSPRSAYDQVWLVKEFGTLISFVGLVALILATFELLLTFPAFAALAQPAQPLTERRDRRWWAAVAVTAILPALTYFPLMKVGQLFFPMPPFPQWVQNQLLVWALGTALITLALGVVLKRGRPVFTNRWALATAAAVVTMAVGYVSLVVVDGVFRTDYRFWVLGLKPLNAARAVMVPAYLVLWTLFFLIALRALAANVAVKGDGWLASIGWAKLAMSGGFLLLVAIEYATLFTTGRLATPTEPLNVIVAIQFVPLLAVVGLIAAFTYRRTNSYVPGALICAMLVTWYITSGTANHWAPGFEPQLPGAARGR
ncbi:MAG: alpha/beta fold hydrolase [Pseudomonadota bacterium]